MIIEEQAVNSQQWFSNKDLFNMINDMNKQIIKLCLQIQNLNESMEKLVENYADIEKIRNKLSECEGERKGKDQGGNAMFGYIVGAIGLGLAILQAVMR